jgi:hypothetical protein
MFCAPGLIFGGTEGVRSRFHIFRSRTYFGVPRASGPFFMFCAPGLVFGGTVGVGSRLNILRARTHFRWYRGRRVPFSCLTLPNSFSAVPRRPVSFSCFSLRDSFSCFSLLDMFSAVPRAWGPVFMSYALGLIFGGTEGVQSRFHVLRSRTLFRWYRGRRVPFSSFRRYRVCRVPFSYFARPYSFSTVLRAWVPVFIFCAPGLFFGGTEGVRSRFHVFRSGTRFRRCRGRRVPFSRFALPDSFSAVPRASGPVFMFCAPGLIFGGAECLGSPFHVLRSRTRFRRYRGRRVSF